ncbi:MAG: Tex-like N-terminal domain-containing protein, partial [Pirellulales bacterium]
MDSSKPIDLKKIARTQNVSLEQVQAVVDLLDSGNTVPFITRYRKDQTGGLDEEQIRQVQAFIDKQRQLAERRQQILRSIESQGKLTDELKAKIERAGSMKRLDDLYLPYRRKKQTLASAARERGLEPLAEEILHAAEPLDVGRRACDFVRPEKEIPNVESVLHGVGHIVAELFSERVDLRQMLRELYKKTGKLVSSRGELPESQAKPYRDYFEFSEPLGKIPPHRVLAINRGERAKALRVRIEVDEEAVQQAAEQLLAPEEHPHREFLLQTAHDALARLILPSLEREQRRELTDHAELHAVDVFAQNLRKLLLQPPVSNKRVLAMDPGFKSGCKLAALDEFGSLLDHDVIHLIGPAPRKQRGRERFVEMIQNNQVSVIAIGNGTACRETEEFVADVLGNELNEAGVAYAVVNEAGASVYSTSQLGREEFPEYDATLRGAISIGRRLQDPLSELVKIDAASIGVGLYQHDLKARHLRDSLDGVVES